MSQLSDLIDNISFRDELAQATKTKAELVKPETVTDLGLSLFSDDFNNETIVQETAPVNDPPPHVETFEEEYDAEQNAESLVRMLGAVDGLILSFVANFACRQKAGGAKTLKKMKEVLTKELSGKELTDHEQLLKAKFMEYKENMKILAGEVLIGEDEIQNLIRAAIPYCQETKLKVGPGTAFWLTYVGNVTTRSTKIMGV